MISIKEINHEDELKQAFAIRMEVFVAEQGVSADAELDEHDAACIHVLASCGGNPAGTGRLRFVDDMAKLERICVLAQYRTKGIGRIIVQKLEEIAVELACRKFKLHGQTHAEGFYISMGYAPASEVFLEEGIEHKLFLKEAES